jgi:gas vesicle protein
MDKQHGCTFLIGLSAGCAIGMLFAPHSGKKTRSQIGEAANKGAAYMKERGEAVCGLVDQGKDEVVRQAEDVVEGVKRRVQDYKKAVS